MKILSIYIKNTKCIEIFNCDIDGDHIVISGDTGTGKTTAVSALWEIIESRGNLLKNDAEGSGDIKVTLGEGDREIIATRHFTKKTNTISITSSDSGKITPTEFKKMISKLSVNPHKIIDMEPRDQIQVLLNAADLHGYDLDAADKSIAEAEEKRLEAHRQMKTLKPGEAPEKVERVTVEDVISERQEAVSHNESNAEKRERLAMLKTHREEQKELKEQVSEEIEELRRTLEKKEAELKHIEKEITVKSQRIEKGEQVCGRLEDIDLSQIDAKLSELSDTNEKATRYEAWLRDKERYDKAVSVHQAEDQEVKRLKQERKEALEDAQWPIDGLSIDSGTLLYHGVEIDKLGTSEQMLVCAALVIDDVRNHPIHVVRMDGIESMSKQDFAKLQELYADADIQILSTRVAREAVEDGEIEIVEGRYEEKGKESND